ncbi:thioredoxin family protein [Flagellimonas baculiformis]|uniref:thioredoxin family protein n=1 Tax=Flagellimonas baculiformis TaxID=3067310 RepID=UPI00296EA45A|nr:thioredoxin family protein [Muricauda sp. D6]
MEVVEKDRQALVEEALSKGKEYQEYREQVHRLAEEGKTTGLDPSEARINFTQLNDRRMHRWEKTFKLPEDVKEQLSKLDPELVFLVLTESWCGDAAASLPIMDKIAEGAKNVDLKVVFRDENLELMDAFLTNGSRSIPKLIVLDKKKGQIVGEWGPRPSIATEMVEAFKAAHGKLTDDFKQELQVWYNKDKGQNILSDMLQLLALE